MKENISTLKSCATNAVLRRYRAQIKDAMMMKLTVVLLLCGSDGSDT